jgi:hypothetical protein
MKRIPLVFVALASTGCSPRLFMMGLQAATAIAHIAYLATPPPEVVYVGPPAAAYEAAPPLRIEALPPPAAPQVEDPGARPFDVGAAHAALAKINVADCWPAGAVRGYGKARITFRPDGQVSLIEITNPVEGQPPDRACVSERFGAASVPPFRGVPTPVATTYFVP